jgi:uncharacterized Rmd1/YagE family protein
MKLTAFLVANQLDVKGIKSFLEIKPAADSSSELFYSFGSGKHQYYFNYGVIVFSGHTEEEMRYAVKAISAYIKNPVTSWLRDEYEINVNNEPEPRFDFGSLSVDRINDSLVRVAMLNLAQSVALDYYHETSENLLTEIKGFTRDLETSGKLNIGRKNMTI